ncbi:T9SS type A sorting domain-containing protein [Winogradskyella sp. SYSU M77433]|uniref:T9SS type A sorting domain-containing protein n=1 Tax=Winogradskyella sp. SYSU M77433 TaxID=3042722 RepID=UPI00248127A3|nr:T9SS type A sorting domain-containing protein [Winogradskyella sp. SYSU M77433]MDH7912846.1 hypothetical protein [Winogradskyella sp. SYSU M77433]
MFYNLLNYPLETAVPNREQDLQFILSDYQPDLFLVCELNNSTGANNILNITRNAISTDFEMATYVSNTSDDNYGDQNDLQNLLYYNSSKFILEEEIIVPTYLRDFNVYRLKLNSTDQATNPVEFYVIIGHLKASSGTTNAQSRFDMVEDLEDYLDTLPSDANVILGGDLNLYTSSEPAFQELLSTNNNITFLDLADRIGSWHNNVNYVDVFSQSTRTQTGMGGTTGGFDDRFDFILGSESMIANPDISYVDDSYQVYGNNGLASCHNSSINSVYCGDSNSEFSSNIRDALHNFSDHLPVTVLLETNATLLYVSNVENSKKLLLEKTLFDDVLTVRLSSEELFNETLEIYNSLGQKIKTLKTNTESVQRFDISDLQGGIYLLAVPKLNLEPLKFIIAN